MSTLTAVARTTATLVAETPAGETPVVLLVTSDANMRSAAARVLAREGYQVVTASHAGHALLASMRERIDLLAVELSMDEMSGPALASRLRREHPMLGTVYFAHEGTTECESILVRPFTSVDLLNGLTAARAAAICAGAQLE